jgi:hypothetical protein
MFKYQNEIREGYKKTGHAKPITTIIRVEPNRDILPNLQPKS